MSKLPVTLGVAAAVVILDQVTKALAVHHLEGHVPIELLGPWLKLTFVRNPGAAFSFAGNATILISIIAIVVTVAIVRTARTLASTWWAVVLGGVLGGALGNLLDRLFRAPGPFRGEVVDFLQLPSWPVFNVADMALVGSAILAVILSIAGLDLLEGKDHGPGSGPTSEPGASEQEWDQAAPAPDPPDPAGREGGGR